MELAMDESRWHWLGFPIVHPRLGGPVRVVWAFSSQALLPSCPQNLRQNSSNRERTFHPHPHSSSEGPQSPVLPSCSDL